MDRLQSMRTFLRVVEAGSFAAAARECELSPATVTRLIADLENHLGTRLLSRTARRLALTDTGEHYLERVRTILVEIDDAEASAAAANAEPRGQLRVLVPPSLAAHQIAKLLPRFRAQYPRVSIDLVAPGAVETVDETFDVTLIVIARPLADGDFVARRLAQAEVIACASPAYLDRLGRPEDPPGLAALEAIVAPSVRELVFHRGAESVGFVPRRSVLSTTHVDTMYAAACAGLGVVGLPSFVVEDALRQHALERVLPEWHLSTFDVYAAMPTRKHLPARTRAFVAFLLQALGGGGADPWRVAAGGATPQPAQ